MKAIEDFETMLKECLEAHGKENPNKEVCEGKCGMNYCDDNGCIDRKRNLVEPKDNPEHCG